jgi:hypothetical protein
MLNKIDKWLADGMGGHAREELQSAFDMVKNPEHWKADIDAVVPSQMQHVLSYAIPWFVGGGDIDFIPLEDGKMRVLASGYWSNGMEG